MNAFLLVNCGILPELAYKSAGRFFNVGREIFNVNILTCVFEFAIMKSVNEIGFVKRLHKYEKKYCNDG
jgi:hypothetical protein